MVNLDSDVPSGFRPSFLYNVCKLVLKWAFGGSFWLSKETLSEVMLLFVAMRCVAKVLHAELSSHVVQWFSLSQDSLCSPHSTVSS